MISPRTDMPNRATVAGSGTGLPPDEPDPPEDEPDPPEDDPDPPDEELAWPEVELAPPVVVEVEPELPEVELPPNPQLLFAGLGVQTFGAPNDQPRSVIWEPLGATQAAQISFKLIVGPITPFHLMVSLAV